MPAGAPGFKSRLVYFFYTGLFLSLLVPSPNVREPELAKIDANRRAVGMLNLMRDTNEGKYRRGEGETPVSRVFPECRH